MMRFSESTQRYRPTVIYGTGRTATIDDEKYFVNMELEQHHAAGVQGTLDKHGTVLVMVNEDPDAIFMIDGVSLDVTRPCTFSSSALGFSIQELAGNAFAVVNGKRQQVGYPGEHERCELKIEFLLPPLARMRTIRPSPSKVPEELRHRLFSDPPEHKEDDDDEIVEVHERPFAQARRHFGPDQKDRREIVTASRDQRVPMYRHAEHGNQEPKKLASVIQPAQGTPMAGIDLGRPEPRTRPSKRSSSRDRRSPAKRPKAPVPRRSYSGADGSVTTVFDRDEGPSPLFRAGRILPQLLHEEYDEAAEKKIRELADKLDEELVWESYFNTVEEYHVAVGHPPPIVVEPHLTGDHRIRRPGSACESCRELNDYPEVSKNERRILQTLTSEVGAVINASVVEDAAGHARIAVYSEEATTYMLSQTLREGMQMEDYLTGLRRMVELIRAGPSEEPPMISVRSKMYTRSPKVTTFLREHDLRMVSDTLEPFVVLPGDNVSGLLEFIRHRRARLRAAGLSRTNEYMEYEVSYIIRQHNTANYSGRQSATLRLLGRIDDRLFIGYRQKIEAEINGEMRPAEFFGYAEKEFGYIVMVDQSAYVVSKIEPIDE